MELAQRDALSVRPPAGRQREGEGQAEETAESKLSSSGDELPIGTLLALAEVLYPSGVNVTRDFLRTYLSSYADDSRQALELRRGTATLDDWAEDAFGAEFADLDVERRDRLLEEMGIHLVSAVPNGSALERLRYHVVDELLVAFYISPTGRRLIRRMDPTRPGGDSGRPGQDRRR